MLYLDTNFSVVYEHLFLQTTRIGLIEILFKAD